MQIPVLDMNGTQVNTIDLPADIFEVEINNGLMHQAYVRQMANARLGTHKVQRRGEMKATTAKMYRQKGTGRARAGNLRTPIRRGGGHTFARRPIDYSYRLPKKAVRLATRMALLSKFLDGQATVLDRLSVDEPKTKVVTGMLRALGLSETTCLLAIEGHDENIWRSSRNIPSVEVAPAAELNAYVLLHQRQLLVTRGALDLLCGKLVGAGVDAG